jgi:hypothetical protein
VFAYLHIIKIIILLFKFILFFLFYYTIINMDVIKKLDKGIDSIFSTLIKEPTLIRGSIHLLLMLYAARIAPGLPDAVLVLFENQYFKLFVFALILWTAQFSPSTSILIAIAFMVSINYANKKPLWEFMEGQIQLLDENERYEDEPIGMAPETTTMAPETTTMAPETTTMAPTTTTMAPTTTTMAPTTTTMAPTTPTMAPETTAAIEAVVELAKAAASTTAAPVEQVVPIAQVAAAATTTPAGLQAVQVLAEQAVVSTPTPVPEVKKEIDTAVKSIVTPKPDASIPEGGCYPIRRYDMTKVSPISDILYGFESYSEFKI